MSMSKIIVTAGNLVEAREACAAIDQRELLEVGCETWGIMILLQVPP